MIAAPMLSNDRDVVGCIQALIHRDEDTEQKLAILEQITKLLSMHAEYLQIIETVKEDAQKVEHKSSDASDKAREKKEQKIAKLRAIKEKHRGSKRVFRSRKSVFSRENTPMIKELEMSMANANLDANPPSISTAQIAALEGKVKPKRSPLRKIHSGMEHTAFDDYDAQDLKRNSTVAEVTAFVEETIGQHVLETDSILGNETEIKTKVSKEDNGDSISSTPNIKNKAVKGTAEGTSVEEVSPPAPNAESGKVSLASLSIEKESVEKKAEKAVSPHTPSSSTASIRKEGAGSSGNIGETSTTSKRPQMTPISKPKPKSAPKPNSKPAPRKSAPGKPPPKKPPPIVKKG